MDWKKLLYAVITAIAVFLLLWFFGSVFNPKYVYAVFAIVVGYLVYVKMAWWEIARVIKAADSITTQLKKTAETIKKKV
jgi:hypothetical protein